MKIIDLLNKIANEEELPKKIKYNNEIFTIREEKDDYANQNHWFTDRFCLLDLNEEVEMIEEDKKIEKLNVERTAQRQDRCDEITIDYLKADIITIMYKINEIIDYINGGTNGE